MKKTTSKKWHLIDIVILSVQIIFPLVAILISLLFPTGAGSGQLDETTKLSVLGFGLIVPLILLQVSLTVGQNKSEKSSQDIEEKLHALTGMINHINPILERVFLSQNKRILRFSLRRMEEVNSLIKHAVDNQRSGCLKPREYYEELDYLAHLLINDKKLNGKNFSGEIWAMTSFAPDEWVNDDGYEGAWTETLKKMVDMGIKTRRLCIIPKKLSEAIYGDTFVEPKKDDVPQFEGFIKLLKDYYGDEAKRDIAIHYIINDSTNSELTKIAGFFAIKLTNGELYILTGETVDKFGSLTAEVLFNENEIKDFYSLCMKFMTKKNVLENVILDRSKPTGFQKYLTELNIDININ
ncbi:MAG: hypothetical protein M1480_09380 [Bacteroidetes bacterium]|nr:hypothetical protein [Bacteroidota bacterium]